MNIMVIMVIKSRRDFLDVDDFVPLLALIERETVFTMLAVVAAVDVAFYSCRYVPGAILIMYRLRRE